MALWYAFVFDMSLNPNNDNLKLVTNNNQIIVILVIATCKYVLHVSRKVENFVAEYERSK